MTVIVFLVHVPDAGMSGPLLWNIGNFSGKSVLVFTFSASLTLSLCRRQNRRLLPPNSSILVAAAAFVCGDNGFWKP